MPYGFGILTFCVINITKNRVLITKKSWCVHDAIWINKETFLEDADYIKTGKPKRFWKYLPWRDLVLPFTDPY